VQQHVANAVLCVLGSPLLQLLCRLHATFITHLRSGNSMWLARVGWQGRRSAPSLSCIPGSPQTLLRNALCRTCGEPDLRTNNGLSVATRALPAYVGGRMRCSSGTHILVKRCTCRNTGRRGAWTPDVARPASSLRGSARLQAQQSQ
jgi:hypothetical protein